MFDLLYHPDAVRELAELPATLRGKMARLLALLALLALLEQRGNSLRFPQTRPVEDGLFELRASGVDIARAFFVFQQGKRIFILRCFVKKTEKTPRNEILLALQRLEELTDD
ncbi:type II toxin-antitoxin system RelE/ParE family toxin [Acerihabitans sp. TG2]|uniref:type II toxin-antitoxin system RelE/ParE family toxin n=1 Tax=Acerihabitans sp. TG2 TaxID=3096008 RepID=UPI002B23A20B|nr:type II toxin-antitoxin system RelE/ParE family toxin [Acerihabitans sp. TG2]MEA9391846.1 type II toxin-antitoxin system RelE/ParE family toxin [Acerihabitans sp. TG2]